MSTGTSCHFKFQKNLVKVWFYTFFFFMIWYMYIALGQGQTAPRGQNFDVNRKAKSRKIGQGQPRTIIWTNLVVLEHLMLHTKFQGRLVPEKKIFKIFYHIWTWRPSWSWDQDRLNKLSFPCPKEAPYEIWLIGPVVSEDKMFKECGRQTTDDRGLPIL